MLVFPLPKLQIVRAGEVLAWRARSPSTRGSPIRSWRKRIRFH